MEIEIEEDSDHDGWNNSIEMLFVKHLCLESQSHESIG
jgi:hypothetical protein